MEFILTRTIKLHESRCLGLVFSTLSFAIQSFYNLLYFLYFSWKFLQGGQKKKQIVPQNNVKYRNQQIIILYCFWSHKNIVQCHFFDIFIVGCLNNFFQNQTKFKSKIYNSLFQSRPMKSNPNQWTSVVKKPKQEKKEKKEKKLKTDKKKQEKNSEQVQMIQEEHADKITIKKTTHLLTANQFFESKIEMLIFPSTVEVHNRVFGIYLVNEDLRIVYADKLAKQYLQASFTPSFSSKTLLDLIVESQREQFIQDCQDYIQTKNSPFLYLIYSRKTLRKTKFFPQIQNPHNEDTFFRYLKCLRSILCPVLINLSSYQLFKDDNNYWNDSLIKKNQMMKCYVFKVSQSQYIPDISYFDFSQDDRMNKFKKLAAQGRVRKQKDEKEKQEKEKNEDPQIKRRIQEILAKRKLLKKLTQNKSQTSKRNLKQDKKNDRKNKKNKEKAQEIQEIQEIEEIDEQIPIPVQTQTQTQNQTTNNYYELQESISKYFN